jgi:transcriptional regulator with XRE-family HTH domain
MSANLKITGAGVALVRLREAAGLTQSGLAERLGWDRSRVHKYENDERDLNLPAIEDIARALGQRPEVVTLYCLKQRYPKIAGSEVGGLLDDLVRHLGPEGS